ncbi:MAG: hybrid sensor histidine kinase/response regulator, partial [Rhodospirillaceae bacterium]|nr:hybrid sensor histidine kinase/response regulator [Rhodospirillaceae bacterium]
HDLRQPMNALRLFVSSLREKKLPDDVQEPLNNIERSAKSLSDMLNAVLDISKFESGAAQPEKINFPVQQIFSILVEEFAPMARDKGLRFKMVPSSCTIYTDPYMLERIIRNFLSNAYRYTDSGKILIGCRRHGEHLSIEVHDTGRGVSTKHTGKIFEEFFRSVSNGGSGHPTGLGLGLAIVDSLSRALGHSVHVSSHRGVGSAFSVEVPIGKEDASQQAFEPIASTEIIDGELLIIDDDELSRSGLYAITSQWVRTVNVAGSMQDAVKAIEDGKITPDAIISDYRLENDENGVMAISTVRSALNKAIPGALISGDTGDDISAIAEANDLPLLRKPIAPSQLRATVIYLLK